MSDSEVEEQIPKPNERQLTLMALFNRLSRQREWGGESKPVPRAIKLHEIRAEVAYTEYDSVNLVSAIEQLDSWWLQRKYDQIRLDNGN